MKLLAHGTCYTSINPEASAASALNGCFGSFTPRRLRSAQKRRQRVRDLVGLLARVLSRAERSEEATRPQGECVGWSASLAGMAAQDAECDNWDEVE